MATDHITPVQAIQQRPPYKKKSQQNKLPSKPPDSTVSSDRHVVSGVAQINTWQTIHKLSRYLLSSCFSWTLFTDSYVQRQNVSHAPKLAIFLVSAVQLRQVLDMHLPKGTVLYLRDASHAPKKSHCDVTACTPTSPNVDMSLVVDSGSAVSILPYRTYEKCFSDTLLKSPAMQLVTYTKRKIPLLGCLGVKVSRGNVSSTLTFYVVKRGTPILGRDLMKALKICIKGNTVLPPQTAVMTTQTVFLLKYAVCKTLSIR